MNYLFLHELPKHIGFLNTFVRCLFRKILLEVSFLVVLSMYIAVKNIIQRFNRDSFVWWWWSITSSIPGFEEAKRSLYEFVSETVWSTKHLHKRFIIAYVNCRWADGKILHSSRSVTIHNISIQEYITEAAKNRRLQFLGWLSTHLYIPKWNFEYLRISFKKPKKA